MGIDLDKHDLFRNGVPGFIFLLVLFSYLITNNNIEMLFNHNGFLASVMVIAIALPIGYLIHNIYRAIHIRFELTKWESYESNLISIVLGKKEPINLKVDKNIKDKELSWFIEFCLNIESSESVRVRGYHLISRIHSLGGSMVAIFLSVILSFFLPWKCDGTLNEHLIRYVSLSVVWILIILLLLKARATTHEAYKIWVFRVCCT